MPIDLSSAVSGGISSAANGLLGLAGNAIAYSQQKKLAAQAQEYTRENMATQYKNSRSMVQDSPGLTVAGMRAAGLNPAFANGSMTGNIASSPSSSTPSAPQSSLQGLGSSAIESYNQSRVADSEVEKNEASAERDRADANRTNVLYSVEYENIVKQNKKLDSQIEEIDAHVQELEASAKDKNASAEERNANAEKLRMEKEKLGPLYTQQLENLKEEYKYISFDAHTRRRSADAQMVQAAAAQKQADVALRSVKVAEKRLRLEEEAGQFDAVTADLLGRCAVNLAQGDLYEAEANYKKLTNHVRESQGEGWLKWMDHENGYIPAILSEVCDVVGTVTTLKFANNAGIKAKAYKKSVDVRANGHTSENTVYNSSGKKISSSKTTHKPIK